MDFAKEDASTSTGRLLMKVDGWKYYNHAAIPTTAPHEQPNLAPVMDGSIWKMNGKPLLAQWVSDWDCKEETSWWYIIKDTPFDISAINRKRRYEINKGVKNFDVKKIQPAKYIEELSKVQEAALQSYSQNAEFDRAAFVRSVESWNKQVCLGNFIFYGAFSKESGELAAFSFFIKNGKCYDFAVQKANPAFEKLNVNAAIINGMLEDCKEDLANGYYLCDGSRSINHETKFQDYLEKNFEFRKAYCRLNLRMIFPINVAVILLYPFRKFVEFIGRIIKPAHLLSAVLKMEQVRRNCK